MSAVLYRVEEEFEQEPTAALHLERGDVALDPAMLSAASILPSNGTIDLGHFLDFCNMLEAIVLHERAIIIYQHGHVGTYWLAESPELYEATVGAFRREGILCFAMISAEDQRAYDLSGPDPTWAAFAMSAKSSLPFLASHGEAATLASMAEKSTGRAVSLIRTAYKNLATHVEAELTQLRDAGRQYEVFIPPIASVLLNQVSSPHELGEAVLEQRERCRSMRETLREYESMIQDDAVPSGKALKARKKLQLSMALLTGDKAPDCLNLTEWGDLSDILEEGEDWWKVVGIDERALIKMLLNKPVSVLVRMVRRRRLMYLFEVKRKLERISGYSQLVAKVFGSELKDLRAH